VVTESPHSESARFGTQHRFDHHRGRTVSRRANGHPAFGCFAHEQGIATTDREDGNPDRQHVVSRMVCYDPAMGVRNYLIEGVSGAGKTSVCKELQSRGYHAINGDTELAYQGDPETGDPVEGRTHELHIWHVDRVKALVASNDTAITFFCGGSRNFSDFIELFDGIFVLEVDLDTLNRRLDERAEDEWGGRQTERQLIARLHQTREDIPKNGTVIDATAPIAHVVDEILRRSEANKTP